MRISDWSSDVCSSDLLLSFPPGWNLEIPAGTMLIRVDVVMSSRPGAGGYCAIIEAADLQDIIILRGGEPESDTLRMMKLRSEERRVGKECVSTFRSRWSPHT